MSASILDKLKDELAVLESELQTFKNSVSYLDGAKKGMQEAIGAVTTAESYHQRKLDDLQTLHKQTAALISGVNVLTENINKVDFPARLESIEKRLGTITQELNRVSEAAVKELGAASKIISNLEFDKKIGKLQHKIEEDGKASFSKIEDVYKGTKDSFTTVHETLRVLQSQYISKLNEISALLEAMQLVQRLEQVKKVTQDTGQGISEIKTDVKYTQEMVKARIEALQTKVAKDLSEQQFVLFRQLKRYQIENRVIALLILFVLIGIPVLNYIYKNYLR